MAVKKILKYRLSMSFFFIIIVIRIKSNLIIHIKKTRILEKYLTQKILKYQRVVETHSKTFDQLITLRCHSHSESGCV